MMMLADRFMLVRLGFRMTDATFTLVPINVEQIDHEGTVRVRCVATNDEWLWAPAELRDYSFATREEGERELALIAIERMA